MSYDVWRLLICFACVLLSACANVSVPLVDVVAGLSGQLSSNPAKNAIPDRLNPSYRYLRVSVAGRSPALMVLGYIDPHPLGDIEVWYSAKREVLKTQAGRVVASAGLELDWRHVDFPAPPVAWANAGPSFSYQRVRDVMPGYRMGLREAVHVQALSPPQELVPPSMPRGATWYQELVVPASKNDTLAPAWFAVVKSRSSSGAASADVVASYQCLSASLCLQLQRWPVVESP
ncbi:MAG: hypothetical protein RLZZ591_2572 [Pseudomonadota bacterium]|jgi:hypothetical protein